MTEMLRDEYPITADDIRQHTQHALFSAYSYGTLADDSGQDFLYDLAIAKEEHGPDNVWPWLYATASGEILLGIFVYDPRDRLRTARAYEAGKKGGNTVVQERDPDRTLNDRRLGLGRFLRKKLFLLEED